MAVVDPATAPTKFAFSRWPQNDEELWWWVRGVWGKTIPRTRVCPHHSTPFEAFADAFFARSPVSVWYASRGFGGKTDLLSTLGLTEAVALAAQITILGGSGAQSLNVHASGQQCWASPTAPHGLLADPPTKYDTRFVTGAWIRSLMASQTSVRGPHPQRLRLDEIDEMTLEILEAAQGQPMRARGIQTQTVMSSTWQYPDKTMAAIMERAKERGWPIFSWCFRETSNPVDGWLTEEDIERKQGEIPTEMWKMEYELQEPSFGNRAFDTAAVEDVFDPDLGEITDDVWRKEGTSKDAVHVTGVDWAKEKDLTVALSFDARHLPWECVGSYAVNKLPWPVMIGKVSRQWERFPGTFAHDATGIGNVVSDFIDPDLIRKNRGRFHDYVMGGGRARQDLFSEYISAIENRDIRFPRIERIYKEHLYCSMDDLFGKGHPPDSVVAGAIAWQARARHQRPRIGAPRDRPRAGSPHDPASIRR